MNVQEASALISTPATFPIRQVFPNMPGKLISVALLGARVGEADQGHPFTARSIAIMVTRTEPTRPSALGG